MLHLNCNQPKPLSGIETKAKVKDAAIEVNIAINLNPYQGLKHSAPLPGCDDQHCNQPKPLSGIETEVRTQCESCERALHCNQPKPLSGIETLKLESERTRL